MPFDNPYFPQTFDIGTPGAGHIHFGADGSLTLFGADGVTVDASLDPTNGLQIFKGSISTTLAGQRLQMIGSQLRFFSGNAGEVANGQLFVAAPAGGGHTFTRVALFPPQLNAAHIVELILNGGSSDGFIPASAFFQDETGHTIFNLDQTGGSGSLNWDGNTFTINGGFSATGDSEVATQFTVASNVQICPRGLAFVFFNEIPGGGQGDAQSIYIKSDGHFYAKDAFGVEHQFG